MEKYNITKLDLDNIDEILEILSDYSTPIISKVSILLDLKNTDSEYYGVIIENKVAGFIGISKKYDHADIIVLAVKKEMTRKKIATFLLKYIILKCQKYNFDSIFLEVRRSNFAAIKLYELMGFKKISERKGYYKDNNEDAIIYRLNIIKATA